MSYDEDLARRIRALLAERPNVTERRMFGGLAFLVGGHMAVSASGQGGLLLRIDPADAADLGGRAHAQPFEMRGRPMRGWLRVAPDGIRTQRELRSWVERAVAYAGSLPAES